MLNPPQQHPYAHCNTTGHDFTPEESFIAISGRPGAIAALVTASLGEIASPAVGMPWASSDARMLRIHGCLRKIGLRLDASARLVITDHGRDVLFLLGLTA